MHRITVLGLGPGAREHITLGAAEALSKARLIVLRTARHGAADYLRDQGIAYQSLDALYEQSADFDGFAQGAAAHLIALAQEGPLCYGVADPGADASVEALLALAGDKVALWPGVALEAPMLAAQSAPRPLMITDAMRLRVDSAQHPVCLTELNSRELAGDCKLKLLDYYDADSPLYFFPPSQGRCRRVVETTLEALDRQPRYDHSAGALLLHKPGWDKARYDLVDLLRLMRRLRAPDGCPWDREQSHQSLARYLLEEAHEAAHAIYQEDWEALADELGDVLLQVVFHAVVGEEQGHFGFQDITSAICSKLIRRHRHIFGGERLGSAEEVAQAWEGIKAEERGEKSASEKMRELPGGLPPMLRSLKAQELAGKLGFDWPDARGALRKVHEEADELLADYEAGRDIRDELGDLFTACINTARLMGANPDEVVDLATDKFIKRFALMEKAIKMDKKDSRRLTLDDWDVYWERGKQEE